MAIDGSLALYAVLGVYALAWLGVVAANAWRLVKIVGLQGEDRAHNRGWWVWTASVASLFLGCVVAAVVWGAVEWVLEPLDPEKDSIGTIQLTGLARTNIVFVIVSNVLVGIGVAFLYGAAASG